METCNCLVLAAGKSTRIASIAKGKPKPLIDIKGESILSRNCRWLSAAGIQNIFINLHYQAALIQDHLGNGSRFGLNIHYINEPDILGTAGALRNAAEQWNNDKSTLVIYGDNLLKIDLKKFRQFHQKNSASITIALFDQNKHPHTGIAGGRVTLDAQNQVQAFQENNTTKNTSLINAGAYWIENKIIQKIPKNSFYDFGKDLFPYLLKNNISIHGYIIDGYCLGLDTPESFQKGLDLIETAQVKLI